MKSTNQGWTTLGQGSQPDSNGGSTSYSMKQGGKDKCWKCDGLRKKNYLNSSQAKTSNLNPSQPCSHCNAYGHDVDHYLTFHPRLQNG